MIQIGLGFGPRGLGVLLVLPGRSPVLGELDPGLLSGLGARLSPLLAPREGLVLAASDPELAARERQAGEALAALLDGPGARPVREALIAHQAREGRAPVCLELHLPALRALPWELLAALPPDRGPLALPAVARIQAGPPPSLPPAGVELELRLWVADPEDPVLAALAQAHERAVTALPGIRLRRLPPDLAGGPEPGGLAVLHLLAHGQGEARIGLQALAGRWSAETLSAGLRAWSAGALLAVVDVCGGARPTEDPADGPAARLLLAGLPAAVGPRTRWSAEASRAFCGGLYEALAEGEALEAAVQRARRALRLRAIPHESGRWWTPQLLLCAPLAATLPARRAARLPPGLPPPGPDALALAEALGRAEGYLGVEHLLAAAADPAIPLPAALLPLRPAFDALARQLPPLPLGGPPAPSPRLRALFAELPKGFRVRELLRLLVLVPWLAERLDPGTRARLLAPAEDDGRGTLPFEPPEPEAPGEGPGLWLEVEGGPEDGRRLRLLAGEDLGRWDPGQPELRQHRLYVEQPEADRALSRRHLRALGEGRVVLQGSSRLVRADEAPRPVGGELALRPGDRLLLGACTRLRVR